MSVAEIQQSVLELSDAEKAKLAAWLLDRLPPASGEEGGDKSIAEAKRRREELDSGRVKAISEKEFWAGIQRE